jgi:hypothetical protein
MRRLILAAALAFAACSAPPANESSPAAEAEYDLAAARAQIAPVPMQVDTSFLTPEERQVVNYLIQASDLMSEIYLRQVHRRNPELRAAIASGNDPRRQQLLDMFDLHFGVWDSLAEDKPFYGASALPVGAGFYPEDLTREAFDAYLAAHPEQREALLSPYTVVKREGDGLIAVPYSREYRQWLVPAAELLRKAAASTSNASLKKFLSLRADAFLSDDYFQSELAWMDVEGTPIEVAIGPYEVYTDRLYGTKTAFESFVTVRDPRQSADLARYKQHLRDMEANLPVEEKFKNFQRGFSSPIVVADQVYSGGDAVPGVQTVAFNLPNDERVREAKGAKKVILNNVLGAKYERILSPMASQVLVPDQARLVTKKYMAMETLFHELSHSLGPGSITVAGRKTSVDKELKEQNSAIEEAKADAMGVWNILYLSGRGEFPAAEKPQLLATYFAGIFRAVRFGIDEAHGRGAAAQYSFLKEKRAFAWDDRAKRYRVDPTRMEGGIRDFVATVVRLQATGDYAGAKAFLERYAKLDDDAKSVLATMSSIPVDIQPAYPKQI